MNNPDVPEFLRAGPPGIDATLATREANYGAFEHQARVNQGLKQVMHQSRNWPGLADDMKESLETIASKIGRILNGNPQHIDSWHDIAGYARLIEKRLEPKEDLT